MTWANDVLIWVMTANANMLGHTMHMYHDVPVTVVTNQSENIPRTSVTHANMKSSSAAVAWYNFRSAGLTYAFTSDGYFTIIPAEHSNT